MPQGNQTVGLLNTVTQPEFTDLVEKTFALSQSMVETGVARKLFINSPIVANSGDKRRFDEVDVEDYARLKPEGVAAIKANTNVGYNKTLTVRRFAREIEITHEMRQYNKYPEVEGQLISLRHFCPNRLELDLTHRFTFSTSTSYTDMDGETVDTTTGDGFQLAYSAHTLSASSTTYRNRISGDPLFSQGGLEAGEELMATNIYSNFGERRVKNFNMLVTGDDPNTLNTVKQVLQSTADIDAAHAGVKNVYAAKYTHIVLKRLATTAIGAHDSTKKKWWFLVAAGQGIMGWQAYLGMAEAPNLKSPAAGNNGEDVHTDNWFYGVRCAYLNGTVGAAGLISSNPVSS